MVACGCLVTTIDPVRVRLGRHARPALLALLLAVAFLAIGVPSSTAGDGTARPSSACVGAECHLERGGVPAPCSTCGHDHRPVVSTIGAGLAALVLVSRFARRTRERWLLRAARELKLLRPPQLASI